MWTRQQIVGVAKTPKVYVSAVSASSTLLGAAAGYFYAKTKLSKKYAAIADEEISAARDFYARVFDKPEPEDLLPEGDALEELPQPSTDAITEDDVKEAVEALGQYRGDPVDPDFIAKMNEVLTNPGQQDVAALVEKNVWEDEPVETEDIQFVPAPSSDKPYLITSEAFFENEWDFIEDSYTYFEPDDVLADRNDMVVLDVEGTVGKDNLDRWGWDPEGDENELYVCNIAKGIIVNITRDRLNSYQKAVAGFDEETELRHSERRTKMRRHME